MFVIENVTEDYNLKRIVVIVILHKTVTIPTKCKEIDLMHVDTF